MSQRNYVTSHRSPSGGPRLSNVFSFCVHEAAVMDLAFSIPRKGARHISPQGPSHSNLLSGCRTCLHSPSSFHLAFLRWFGPWSECPFQPLHRQRDRKHLPYSAVQDSVSPESLPQAVGFPTPPHEHTSLLPAVWGKVQQMCGMNPSNSLSSFET